MNAGLLVFRFQPEKNCSLKGKDLRNKNEWHVYLKLGLNSSQQCECQNNCQDHVRGLGL